MTPESAMVSICQWIASQPSAKLAAHMVADAIRKGRTKGRMKYAPHVVFGVILLDSKQMKRHLLKRGVQLSQRRNGRFYVHGASLATGGWASRQSALIDLCHMGFAKESDEVWEILWSRVAGRIEVIANTAETGDISVLFCGLGRPLTLHEAVWGLSDAAKKETEAQDDFWS